MVYGVNLLQLRPGLQKESPQALICVWVTWFLAPDPKQEPGKTLGFMTGCLILQAGPVGKDLDPCPGLGRVSGVTVALTLFTTGSKAAKVSRRQDSSIGL